MLFFAPVGRTFISSKWQFDFGATPNSSARKRAGTRTHQKQYADFNDSPSESQEFK